MSVRKFAVETPGKRWMAIEWAVAGAIRPEHRTRKNVGKSGRRHLHREREKR